MKLSLYLSSNVKDREKERSEKDQSIDYSAIAIMRNRAAIDRKVRSAIETCRGG